MTKNQDAALNLFNDLKQTGMPIPCSLYQEIFLSLIENQKYFQVENMYQQMRIDNVIPDLGCFHTRLQVIYFIIFLI